MTTTAVPAGTSDRVSKVPDESVAIIVPPGVSVWLLTTYVGRPPGVYEMGVKVLPSTVRIGVAVERTEAEA